jgi:hypothetical protein
MANVVKHYYMASGDGTVVSGEDQVEGARILGGRLHRLRSRTTEWAEWRDSA